MSTSDPSSERPVVADGDAINLIILKPAIHPEPQEETTIHSNLEAQGHDIENPSGSTSVRSRIQLTATLLALFVRAILKFCSCGVFAKLKTISTALIISSSFRFHNRYNRDTNHRQ